MLSHWGKNFHVMEDTGRWRICHSVFMKLFLIIIVLTLIAASFYADYR